MNGPWPPSATQVGTAPPHTAQLRSSPDGTLIDSAAGPPCVRCSHPHCDIRLSACGCVLHARCTPVPLQACPNPRCPPCNGFHLELLPMDFTEWDAAKRLAAGDGRKNCHRPRKKSKLDANGDTVGSDAGSHSAEGSSETVVAISSQLSTEPGTSSELRTGRWNAEETAHCDNLCRKFLAGRLPLPDGLKLNEFLAKMLKSKQSRLTKKMKNAKLSTKSFRRTTGCLEESGEATEFSILEEGFFNSILYPLERAEIKFHVQKEWRETFSTYCVTHGQPLNVDRWLESMEELDKRIQHTKDVDRIKRRQIMMGHALRQDSRNPDRGVIISNSDATNSQNDALVRRSSEAEAVRAASFTYANPSNVSFQQQKIFSAASSNLTTMDNTTTIPLNTTLSGSIYSSTTHDVLSDASSMENFSSKNVASPYLHKIISYIHRHHVPFEYVDAWVPSFVPDSNNEAMNISADANNELEKQPKCRLCFAGCMVTKQVIIGDGVTRRVVPLSQEERLNLSAFGEYSESFLFDVGCGLPGRIYHMGVPTWEQSIHNAPFNLFERVGAAQQWGIRTVVGIPVPSPNVGRVVVALYSRHDRVKDHDLVIQLTEEFTRLMPSPKWKLIVDIGQDVDTLVGNQQQQAYNAGIEQNGANVMSSSDETDKNVLTDEIISIFAEHMPSDPSNPGFAYIQGFMSLRLLLLRAAQTDLEKEIVNTILSSYSSYKAGGRTRPDMALMLARDFMFLNQQLQPQQASIQSAPMNSHQMMMSYVPRSNGQHSQMQNNSVYFPTTQQNAAPSQPISSDPAMFIDMSRQSIEDISYKPHATYTSQEQAIEQQYDHQQQHSHDNESNFFMIGDLLPSPMPDQSSQSPLTLPSTANERNPSPVEAINDN